mgnify:CR=1 FL=1
MSRFRQDNNSSISELLDNFYYEADKQAKIKLKTNDLFTFVNRQINTFLWDFS